MGTLLARLQMTTAYSVHVYEVLLMLLARDAQARLALIVAHCLSIHLSICVSICVSVRDSLSHASHVDYRLVV